MRTPPPLPPGKFVLTYGGPAVLLARICHELGIDRLVNSMVRWDPAQCKVSPGTLVVALILNMLVDRKPLYQIDKFFERQDMGLLFSEAVKAANLNDDALGRTLDRIAAIDQRQLVQSVALCAVNSGNIEVRSVHADTTSISVYGQFAPTKTDKQFGKENADAELVNITHGHSKQHRPDLKQFICGLIVNKDGIPMYGDVRDGNFNDKIWNKETLEAIEQHFLDPQGIIYIADSSLMTKKNLKQLSESKIRFISRLPETFKTVEKAKDAAFANGKWQLIGTLAKTTDKAATYKVAPVNEEVDGQSYRLLVTQSSAQDKRKLKKLERTVIRERAELKDAAKKLMRKRFACHPDAEAALAEFLEGAQKLLHTVKGMVIAYTETKYPPGRPKQNVDYPKETYYQVELRIFEPSQETRRAWLERESSFVLITNLPKDLWSETEILEEYKNQHKVEQGFRVFKHPILDDGVLLKSTRRVEAFAYVAILALIVASFLQFRVRTNLAKSRSQLKLLLQERKTATPTSIALLKELDYVDTLNFISPDGFVVRYLNQPIRDEHIRLLELAGYDSKIYTEPLASN